MHEKYITARKRTKMVLHREHKRVPIEDLIMELDTLERGEDRSPTKQQRNNPLSKVSHFRNSTLKNYRISPTKEPKKEQKATFSESLSL